MEALADIETQLRNPAGSSLTYYRLHMPQGPEMRSLPTRYDSLDNAKGAFERSADGTKWCLVGAYESGNDDAPTFVLQGLVRSEGVAWKSLQEQAEPIPVAVRPKVVLQQERMTRLLTPRLGYFTAEEVVRHVCARFNSADFADESQIAELREFLRRGLLAYVDPGAAEQLAARCVDVG